jgi:hypothetical protein
MHAGIFVLEEPIDRVAQAPRCAPIFLTPERGSRDGRQAGKPLSFPCYFGRLRLERRYVSRPPHPWRLAGDAQRAAIAAFNFLKNKD